MPSPAILDVFFCGTVATMRITSAAGIQVYTNDYGTTFGPGAGLGTYGSVGLDNFIGSPPAVELLQRMESPLLTCLLTETCLSRDKSALWMSSYFEETFNSK
ncbi:MAG TPA: hypothetical protein VKB49_15980 [Candidatus Sulfotelmatobacter sp.]|nr:hypothetical protein [Candidatus Sulfotelmatobacter sp.]